MRRTSLTWILSCFTYNTCWGKGCSYNIRSCSYITLNTRNLSWIRLVCSSSTNITLYRTLITWVKSWLTCYTSWGNKSSQNIRSCPLWTFNTWTLSWIRLIWSNLTTTAKKCSFIRKCSWWTRSARQRISCPRLFWSCSFRTSNTVIFSWKRLIWSWWTFTTIW